MKYLACEQDSRFSEDHFVVCWDAQDLVGAFLRWILLWAFRFCMWL
ncbi:MULTISPECIES: hypothetical protein [Hallerella]|nr:MULTISPECIES: hypothetical protein [Hallerella]MCI6872600.1 hypothetical protein [Hallerella sp.]MDY5029422.1 hypothetical protein [Hallerella succinigenes]